MSGCWAPASDPLLSEYHDEEWGRPIGNERSLFERMSLEGFQSGLSWRTVLAKRPAFREVFAGFDPQIVAAFTPADVDRLMADARIIRNRRKIEAVITNARLLAADPDAYPVLVWSFEPPAKPAPATLADVPATSPEAGALSKLLRKRGFAFVGPITVYAGMQACGVVDDHVADCPVRAAVEAERSGFVRPA